MAKSPPGPMPPPGEALAHGNINVKVTTGVRKALRRMAIDRGLTSAQLVTLLITEEAERVGLTIEEEPIG